MVKWIYGKVLNFGEMRSGETEFVDLWMQGKKEIAKTKENGRKQEKYMNKGVISKKWGDNKIQTRNKKL
jgi:hypothetical protein